MKPRHSSLRASLHQLAQDFVDGVLGALRTASFSELETLDAPAAPRAADRALVGPAGTPKPLLATGVLPELTVPPKKRPRWTEETSPPASARPRASRAIVTGANARVAAAESRQLPLPHHGEPLPELDPGIAITDPHALLGPPEPPPTPRVVPRELPAPAVAPERRPGVRTGEELLQSAGGRFVLRRKRSPTQGGRS